jgi:hypothetical protein
MQSYIQHAVLVITLFLSGFSISSETPDNVKEILDIDYENCTVESQREIEYNVNKPGSFADLNNQTHDSLALITSKSSSGFAGYNLPLMIINTHGQTIERTPRVLVDMGLIDNGVGQLNNIGDEMNAYSGKIGINRRGQSSYGFPKLQYRIEFQNDEGSSINVSILGLPEENDFILYGPHSDKTMMKNVLTYELFRKTGRWAPRTRFIEVIVDNEYQGIYVLIERLKRDKHRVDINKMGNEDNSWPAISGGYILRRDKTEFSEPEGWWQSTVKQPYNKQMWYEHHHPGYSDLTQEQVVYIRDWIKDFEKMMSGSNFMDPVSGYKAHIEVESFIDMMFINEITKGIDNYNFSSYFYKENDADGGLLVYGPPWDYNIGYGNVNYGKDWHAAETYGWCYTQGGRIYWFKRLMEDPEFRNKVYCRWTAFRDGIFSDSSMLNITDSCVNVLGDAIDRNFDKYPILGEYIWPAIPPFPETYIGEVENLEDWLLGRLQWMDEQWYGKCQQESAANDKNLIHYWHFNDLEEQYLNEVAADYSRTGQASISYSGQGAGYMDTRTHRSGDPVSNINLLAGQQNNRGAVLRLRNPSVDRAMIIEAPTNGYKDIRLTYATSRTNNGPTHQSLYYSVNDGDDWILVENNYEVPLLPGWGPKIFNFSGFENVSDNPKLILKILFTGDNITGTSGNNRFDNISVKGTPMLSTGINYMKTTPNVLIMPNPVGDFLILSIDEEEDVQGLIRIFHYNGSLVKELNVSGNLIRIPAEDLSPGMYVLSFSNQHINIHKPFIKY